MLISLTMIEVNYNHITYNSYHINQNTTKEKLNVC